MCTSDIFITSSKLNFCTTKHKTLTHSPGVFEVGRHLSPAHFSYKGPKHDPALKLTLGVYLHLVHRLPTRRTRAYVPAEAQAGGQGQHGSAGAAVKPRIPWWQHCIWDVVLI